MHVFFLKLREHSSGYVKEHPQANSLKEQITEHLTKVNKAEKPKILFVLDGYDEFNDKALKIF